MKLALGTAQFGLNYGVANSSGKMSYEEAESIIRFGSENGIDTIDTAINYGDSEGRLGRIGIREFNVISKLPEIPDECLNISAWIESEVRASLIRLGLNSLYGLLLHRPHQLFEKNGKEIYLALLLLKDAGLVRKVGISIYDPAELNQLLTNFEFDLVQAPFNLLDRRLINGGWLEILNGRGIELHVRSVFLQGLLLLKINERPARFNPWLPLWKEYDDWLTDIKISPAQACLRYAVSFSGIAKIIIGVDNVMQLKELMLASEGESPKVPSKLYCDDLKLINPNQWHTI